MDAAKAAVRARVPIIILVCLFVCLDRALAQFPLCWYQVNGVQSSYCNDFETKVELELPNCNFSNEV